MEYIAPIFNSAKEAKDFTVVKIDSFHWEKDGYSRPESYAALFAVKGEGLHALLWSYEENIRCECTENYQPVYTDSCLEFFAAFDKNSDQYVNFEVNSLGTCLATLRGPGYPVVTIDKLIPVPEMKALVEEDHWSVEFTVPFADIKTLFPNSKLEKGEYFRANFYKCGDETAVVHYGMWSEVMCYPPNYHTPQYFGKINII